MRLLEKIIQEVEIFEMAQTTSVSSSVNPVKKHVKNVIMEISSAINKLEPNNNSITEHETGNTDSMRIRLNFLLVQLSMKMITDKYSDMWNDWCKCNVWNCDVLKKLCVTWSNCILSKRVQNYNTVVLKRDNTKMKKYN